MGIEVYATCSSGIGGIIRRSAEDFVVEEILVDNSKAKIERCEGLAQHRVLDSSSVQDHYLLCVLVKRNWDTFLALRTIAGRLSIKPGQIHIAGIKDAKAVTAQHITIEGISAEDTLNVQTKDIRLQPLGYLRHKISSYYLLGNDFSIAIGNIGKSESTIKRRITSIIRELETLGGFPNFFGHQRFGSTRSITHLVGKAIVKGDFEKAAMLFLSKPSPYEHPESREAREQLQGTRDFQRALREFPEQLHYERVMLKHLTVKPEDFVGAFRRLPIKLQQLFVQAFQAYLFNKSLSSRIKEGLLLNNAEEGDYLVSVERSGLPMLTMYRTANQLAIKDFNEAIKSGKMRVAIALIGFKQRLSMGVQGEIEKQVLKEEDVSPNDFKIKALPEISAKGKLRTVLTLLNNFSVKEISNDSSVPSEKEAKTGFMLHRGSYATILLRELMKPRSPLKAGF